jgi:polyhydroxybutyrate depolymerase
MKTPLVNMCRLSACLLWACSGNGNVAPASGAGVSGAIQSGQSAGTAAGSGGQPASSGAGNQSVSSAGSTAVAGRSGSAGQAGGGSSMDDDGGTLNGPDSSLPQPDAGGAGAMAPPIVCTAPALTPGEHNSMLQHGGQQRQYIVHVPSNYDGHKAVPLVLDFHGWTSMADREEGASGWREKSDAVGFIAVYPIGLGDSWNGGALCCGTSQSSGVDDEGFALAVVNKMKADACIDPKRVYVTGISNGGAMSHLLACRHADVFAAAAPVSMGNGTTPCNPSRPISVVMVRGVMDELVAYTGGIFPSAKADFDMWKSIDGCTGSPMTTHQFCETHTGCKAGVEVTLCSLPNGVHNVYQDKAELSVADVAWEAFERQLLP